MEATTGPAAMIDPPVDDPPPPTPENPPKKTRKQPETPASNGPRRDRSSARYQRVKAAGAPSYPLLDAPEDCAVEEHAFVPRAAVATPSDAIAWFHRECSYITDGLASFGLSLDATGDTSWHRECPCGECDGSGAGPRPRLGGVFGLIVAGPREACELCGGTGEQSTVDYVAWESCEPEDDGAVEFWDLEVVALPS